MRTRWLLLSLLLLPPATIAQQEGQVPYIESLDVTVHNVDVVVTDKSGRPVTGLREEDFELLEDGKPQPITNFSVYAEGRVVPPPSAADPSAGEGAGATPSSATSRKFIFYIDEMALPQPTQRKLRARLDKILDDTFRAGDEGLVLRPTKERLGTGFIGEREAVRAALDAAIDAQSWRFSPLQQERYQLNLEMGNSGSTRARRVAARRVAGITRKRVLQRLGNLKSAVAAASAIPGRKVLLVVTDSLPIEPGRELFRAYADPLRFPAVDENDAFGTWTVTENQAMAVDIDWYDLTPLVKEIARTAATGGITIYAIQPEFELGLAAPGDVSARGVTTAQRRSSPPTAGMNLMLDDTISNTESTLRILADVTGGAWHRGGGGIDKVTRQITSDVQSYYSLGYRAADAADVTHRIEVRVKGRDDLRVRARREVLRKSPEREMTDRVVATLVAPPPAREIPIQVEVQKGKVALDKSQRIMNVHTLVPLSALTFLPAGDVYRAQFTVHYAAMGKSSDFVSGMQPPQVVEVPAAEMEKAKPQFFRYTLPLNMRPGKHDVSIGVLDSLSRLSGISRSAITVD